MEPLIRIGLFQEAFRDSHLDLPFPPQQPPPLDSPKFCDVKWSVVSPCRFKSFHSLFFFGFFLGTGQVPTAWWRLTPMCLQTQAAWEPCGSDLHQTWDWKHHSKEGTRGHRAAESYEMGKWITSRSHGPHPPLCSCIWQASDFPLGLSFLLGAVARIVTLTQSSHGSAYHIHSINVN
jgi:hypothetical protein